MKVGVNHEGKQRNLEPLTLSSLTYLIMQEFQSRGNPWSISRGKGGIEASFLNSVVSFLRFFVISSKVEAAIRRLNIEG